MATVIDALLVTLGLDAKGFITSSEKAQKSIEATGESATKSSKQIEAAEKKAERAAKEREKAEAKAAKEREARAKHLGQAIAKVRNEALALLGIFTAGVGIKNFVSGTIASTASLDRMSAKLQMSAKDIAMWELANKKAGGTIEGMRAQLQESQKAGALFATGQMNDSMAKFIGRGHEHGVSVSPEDFKDAETYLRARIKVIEAVRAQKGEAIAQQFAGEMGISEDAYNLLGKGSAAVETWRHEQAGLAEEMAKLSGKARELEERLNDLQNRFKLIALTVLTFFIPSIKDGADSLENGFTKWFDENKGKIKEWVDNAVVAIKEFVKWADKTAGAVGGWKNVLMGLLALKVLGAVSPLLSLAAALFQIGAALGVVGGAKAVAGLGALGKLAKVGGVGAALALHSGELNVGEQDELARLRALGDADFASRGIGPDGKPLTPGAGGDSAAMLDRLEKQYGLPAGLLDAVWAKESSRGKNMLSKAGAKGHFQFMDPTAKQYGLKDPNNLDESADAAARMFRDLLKQNGGDLSRALAGYNWGQGNLQKKGMEKAPKETRDYIASITGTVGRANAVAAARLPSAARSGGPQMAGSSSTSSVENNFNGTVIIQTSATDGKGIAQDFAQEIQRYGFVQQASTGPT